MYSTHNTSPLEQVMIMSFSYEPKFLTAAALTNVIAFPPGIIIERNESANY